MLIDAFNYVVSNWSIFQRALEQHLIMVALSLAAAMALAIPVGVAVARSPTASFIAINAAGTVRTIPSLAILAAALPFLGIGLVPSVVALVVLAVPPILLNTCIGIREVDPGVVDASRGMGMTRLQRIASIELPLALPAIIAGVKTAAIQVIGGAALASFIGGGGLGDFVTAGVALMDVSRLLVGAIPIALLAILAEVLLTLLQRALTPTRTLVEGETP